MNDVHETERYATIDGFTDYLVTSYGRILSLKHGDIRELKQCKNNCKYFQVTLCKNGKTYKKLVHRLVAQSFIPNPDNKPCINHIDENKTNNHVSNLEWCTYKENNNHGTRNERVSKAQKGDKSHNYGKRLSEETKTRISKSNKGKTLSEETKQKISKSLIGKKHTEERKQNFSNSRKGSKNPRAKSVIGFKINGCDIKYYKYMSECEKDGFHCSVISRCCKGKLKSHKGYIWFYTDEFFNKKE